MRYKHKIKFAEKDGNRNVYFTTKRMFVLAYKRRRKAAATVVLADGPFANGTGSAAHGLVDQLLEDAIRIEKTGGLARFV